MKEDELLKSEISTGEGIIRYLKELGVSKVFGIPDGHTLALYDGMLKTEGIDHILCNDERTAAFAADAYARVTHSIGVCDAGAAGAMNFPIALAEAKGFGSPMLALIGVVKSEDKLRNVPHDIDIAGVLKPLTKSTQEIYRSEHVPRFLKYSIRKAMNGKEGPTALIIPEDILQSKELSINEFIPKYHHRSCEEKCGIAPSISEINDAVDLIREAEQPALFVGSQAISSGAFEEVKQLSQLLCAPVFSTISGKGIMISNESSNYFGTIGLFGEKPNHTFIRKSTDLLILVGNRMTEDDTANFKIPPPKVKIIQIDLEPGEIGLNFPAMGVIGDSKIALDLIIERIKLLGFTKRQNAKELLDTRFESLTKLRAKHVKFNQKDERSWMTNIPLKPQRVLFALSKAMGAEDYLVTDASASSRWIGPYFPVKMIGRRIVTPRGVGPTGFGLGALIGTKIAIDETFASKNRPKVVLLTGDGGFMNGGLSDLETIQRLKLDCTIVILNNQTLGFIKFGQAMMYKQRYYHTDRPKSPFVQIAESFGATGTEITSLEELDTLLPKIINTKGFHVLDIQTDPKELLPPNFY
ncbi:3D-(3,5/4)-trihydroxycyclohexane-1,2-dione hydrolase [Candidatus Lokiarchaeum ossiferum]|uniref:3D-(3,5/4)-trihydroxycyclohexane-1,2-dione hydrolase n=1 Tax=Candidatus Lokiarchaeum ossiferum TaxID=2951803 RepID=A0ABY6HNN1_9ARCH|nr:3D-(3,5/4)-trihydroxycyclohexane-1,2-dione hydrolase [Candidatus Lokiarchaeum sp. B-35]